MQFRAAMQSAACLATAALVQLASGAETAEYQLVIIEPWSSTSSHAISRIVGLNNLNQVSGCATPDPLGGPCSFLWTLEGGVEC